MAKPIIKPNTKSNTKPTTKKSNNWSAKAKKPSKYTKKSKVSLVF